MTLHKPMILAVLVLLLMAGAACADDAASLRIPGFADRDRVMVALRDVYQFLGHTVSWTPTTDIISIESPAGILCITPGQTEAEFADAATGDTRNARLSPAPRYAGCLLHGPITSLWELGGVEFSAASSSPTRVELRVGEKRILVELLPEKDKTAVDLARGSVAKLATSRGDIYLDLFDKATPITVGNFLDLIQRGFYDGLTFHRVIRRFMIQGGCPLCDGTGGPGFTIPDEADRGLKHRRGSLSMAKTAAPNTGGSQFFICHLSQPHLDGIHTVFGRCIRGMGIVDRIARGDRIRRATVLWESDDAADAIKKALSARVMTTDPEPPTDEGETAASD